MGKDLSYAFIIRMHYPEGSRAFDERIALFRTMTYPRIKAQGDREFDVCIWCHDWHEQRIKELDPEIKTFNVTDEAYELMEEQYAERRKKFHVDWTTWEHVRGLKQYDVQMGLDSDDIIFPDYVERVKEIVNEYRDSSLHINFQPQVFDLDSLSWYTCPMKYRADRASAFFALYQPDRDDYRFAYEYSHINLGEFMDRSVTVKDKPYCAITVHGNNASTKIFKDSKEIPPPGRNNIHSLKRYAVHLVKDEV